MMNLIKSSAVNFNKNALRSLLSSRAFHISSPLSDKTYYEILRVPEDASQTEIKDAYFKLCKVYHPDIAKDENSLRMFRSIATAYDVLGNVRSRIEYDKETGIQSTTEEMTFHPCGYKDLNEWRSMQPDYDKILAKKPPHEKWEDVKYEDRRMEIQRKRMLYAECESFEWNPLEKRCMRFGVFCFALMVFHHYLDEHYFEKYFDPPE